MPIDDHALEMVLRRLARRHPGHRHLLLDFAGEINSMRSKKEPFLRFADDPMVEEAVRLTDKLITAERDGPAADLEAVKRDIDHWSAARPIAHKEYGGY